MRFVEPVAGPLGPLGRRNPVAKLAAVFVLTFGLLATLDPVAPTIALVAELITVPFFGVRYAVLGRRAWPLLAGALGVALTLILFGTRRTGTHLVTVGPVIVTTGLLITALGLALRLLAVALPGIIVFATTDPTDLGDALVQNAKAPARFAIGALAAFRLMPLLGDEWRMLVMARRARGVDAGGNPVTAIRLFGTTMFGLLVGAIRRGSRLADAMDARGFDSGRPRSSARPQRFGPADWLLIAGSAALVTLALGTSIALNVFRPIL